MNTSCILILGGARSGKSSFAQKLARKLGEPVLFVATALAGDEEMAERIEKHKRARPEAWGLLEVTSHVGREISRRIGEARVVIVDCVTLLVNNVLNQCGDEAIERSNVSEIEKRLSAEINELVKCITNTDASFIIVSNEVGTGLVPTNQLSRLYRDLLGQVNQRLAELADQVYVTIAGLPIQIKPYPYLTP